MKRNPVRTPEELSSRHQKAVELWRIRSEKRWLQSVERIRDEKPIIFARLVCEGALAKSFDDSGAIIFKCHMDGDEGQRGFHYLAELILQRLDKTQPKQDAPYVSLASWIESDADFEISFPWNPYSIHFRALTGTLNIIDTYTSHVRWRFFDAASEALNWSVMKAARMVYRGVPIFERHAETGEHFPVAEDAEDYVYLKQKGKRNEITTGYELPDWTRRYFITSEHIKLHDAIFFSDWDLPPEELELRRSVLTLQCGEPGKVKKKSWPWGDHETELLRKLSSAAHEWWSTYDSDNPATAPTNEAVEEWLKSQNVAIRVSEVMAQILRADGLAAGPRK